MRNAIFGFGCFLCGVFTVTNCSAFVEMSISAGGDGSLYVDDGSFDDTGVRVFNKSLNATMVSIDTMTDSLPRNNETISSHFRLLDNSLKLMTNTGIDGQIRARVRIRYRESQLRERRMRESRLRLFRLDRVRKRWLPAVNLIREKRLADIRRFPARTKDFRLGHYGYSSNGIDGGYVWAVVDMGGEYAIGTVPEPVTLVLLGTGASLLLAKRRRRKDH